MWRRIELKKSDFLFAACCRLGKVRWFFCSKTKADPGLEGIEFIVLEKNLAMLDLVVTFRLRAFAYRPVSSVVYAFVCAEDISDLPSVALVACFLSCDECGLLSQKGAKDEDEFLNRFCYPFPCIDIRPRDCVDVRWTLLFVVMAVIFVLVL